MQIGEGVSIDVLAERLEAVKADVAELATEQRRTRERLHQVEGLTGTLVDQDKTRRRDDDRRQRRLEVRLQVLTAVIAAAAFVEPFLYHLATGK